MTQILPFLLGEERYGLQLTEIQEVIEEAECHFLPAAPVTLIGAVNVHGRILPVLDLALLLGFPTREQSERMIVLARRDLPLVLAVRQVEPILNVDLEQATLTQNEVPRDCIHGVLNWQGLMISLLDLDQLRKVADEECSTRGGNHAVARADR